MSVNGKASQLQPRDEEGHRKARPYKEELRRWWWSRTWETRLQCRAYGADGVRLFRYPALTGWANVWHAYGVRGRSGVPVQTQKKLSPLWGLVEALQQFVDGDFQAVGDAHQRIEAWPPFSGLKKPHAGAA